MSNKQIRDFVLAVLDDDHGISDDTWVLMLDFLQGAGEMALVGEISRLLDGVDGRVFLRNRAPDPEPDDDDSTYYAAPV